MFQGFSLSILNCMTLGILWKNKEELVSCILGVVVFYFMLVLFCFGFWLVSWFGVFSTLSPPLPTP